MATIIFNVSEEESIQVELERWDDEGVIDVMIASEDENLTVSIPASDVGEYIAHLKAVIRTLEALPSPMQEP